MLLRLFLAVLPAILAFASPAQAQTIERYNRHATLPIARAVKVPQTAETLYLSGEVASPSVAGDALGEAPEYGDTEAQTSSVFRKIEQTLHERGYGLGDVVKLTVFLVGVPEKSGHLDMDGFTRAYVRYFGTASQPNLPARSTVQVAGLSQPGYLVEIEAIAAKSGRAASKDNKSPAAMRDGPLALLPDDGTAISARECGDLVRQAPSTLTAWNMSGSSSEGRNSRRMAGRE